VKVVLTRTEREVIFDAMEQAKTVITPAAWDGGAGMGLQTQKETLWAPVRHLPEVVCFALLWTAAARGAQPVPEDRKAPESIVFRLDLNRIEPRSVKVQPGRYTIVVVNGLAIADLDVAVEDGKKTRLVHKRLSRKRYRLTEDVRLNEGTHTVTVGGRAQWTSRIEVIK
jgi:hypothetical protein